MNCMGGWCTLRERCPHYGADGIAQPAERLCPAGLDGYFPGLRDVVELVRMDRAGRETARWPALGAPAHFARAQNPAGGGL